MRRLAVVLVLAAASCTANDDVPAPIVASVTPSSANPGSVLTIAGSYLCQQPGSDEDPLDCQNMGEVDFGDSPVAPIMWTDTSISVEVPNLDTGEIDVSVSVAGRTSNSVSFTVD